MKRQKSDNKAIVLLTSIGLANIGEWIYFIALNMMILNNGGNALTVGILYIIRPVADIVTNLIFSAYIDRIPKKVWMSVLSFLRAILVGLLLFNQSLAFIYIIVFFIQVCASVYEPLSMSYVTIGIPENKWKKFNSLNSLVSSGGFLIGPGLAGFLLSIGTPLVAIIVNVLALLGSGILLLFLPNVAQSEEVQKNTSLLDDYKDAFQYLKSYYKAEPMNVYFYMFVSSLFVLAAGLDSVEAAFSKEVLFMSDGQYGMLVSISGVGFLVGSVLNALIVERLTIRQLILLGGSMYIIGYLIVSTSFNFFNAIISFFLISFALAYINTGFRTYIQFAFPINKIGQLTTAFNIMISLLEMVIVALVSIAGSIIPLRFVLIGIELIMVLIFLFIIHYSKKLKIDLMSERKEEIEIFDGVKWD